MSGLDHLRSLAAGLQPTDDGLLGNCRCTWERDELLGEEAILASFASQPLPLNQVTLAIEDDLSALLIGDGGALFADLYCGRIGRLWRIGSEAPSERLPRVDVAFDADLRQLRGDLNFDSDAHPVLPSAARDALLIASRDQIETMRRSGLLRARGFVIRSCSAGATSAALMAIHYVTNDFTRCAGFRWAVVAVDEKGAITALSDTQRQGGWTPRL